MAWTITNALQVPIGFMGELLSPGEKYSKPIPILTARMQELDVLNVISISGADDQDVVSPVGAAGPSIPLINIISSPVKPDWFTGYTSTWNGDATAAIQAAVQYASDTNRTLKLESTATVDSIFMLPRTRIEGTGERANYDAAGSGGGLRAKRDTTGAHTLALYDQTNQAIWQNAGVEIYGLYVYGDKGYQTVGTPGGVSVSHTGGAGGGSFIPRHKVKGLQVVGAKGDGVTIGSFTRDSYFDDLIVYSCDGNGVNDSGVDNSGSNWNIGQSLKDGVYLTAAACRRSNIKSWGSGQYSTAGDTAGFDGLPSANFVVRNALGVSLSQIYSQESRGYGFRFEGQGVNEIVGLIAKGLYSDGDNGSGGNYAGIHMFRVRKSIIEAFVGKQAAGLAGTPYNGVSIATSSGNVIDLISSGLGSWAFAITSDAYDNSFNNNSMRSGTAVATAVSAYTANPYDYVFHEVTLTANTNFANPGKKDRGLLLDFDLIQDGTGGRVPTFGMMKSSRLRSLAV